MKSFAIAAIAALSFSASVNAQQDSIPSLAFAGRVEAMVGENTTGPAKVILDFTTTPPVFTVLPRSSSTVAYCSRAIEAVLKEARGDVRVYTTERNGDCRRTFELTFSGNRFQEGRVFTLNNNWWPLTSVTVK